MSLNRAAMTGLSVLLVMSAVHCTVFAENAGKFPILEGDCVKLCGALLSEEGDELSDLVKISRYWQEAKRRLLVPATSKVVADIMSAKATREKGDALEPQCFAYLQIMRGRFFVDVSIGKDESFILSQSLKSVIARNVERPSMCGVYALLLLSSHVFLHEEEVFGLFFINAMEDYEVSEIDVRGLDLPSVDQRALILAWAFEASCMIGDFKFIGRVMDYISESISRGLLAVSDVDWLLAKVNDVYQVAFSVPYGDPLHIRIDKIAVLDDIKHSPKIDPADAFRKHAIGWVDRLHKTVQGIGESVESVSAFVSCRIIRVSNAMASNESGTARPLVRSTLYYSGRAPFILTGNSFGVSGDIDVAVRYDIFFFWMRKMQGLHPRLVNRQLVFPVQMPEGM